MNNRALLLFVALIAALTASCSTGKPSNDPKTAPLAGASIGGTFTLTNQDGKSVSDRDFAGRFRLMYFGYTFCPDVCPTDVRNLMMGLREFEKRDPAAAARLQPIFVTVDPARDSPAVLKSFVTAFHPRLVGLTGTTEEIAAVAKRYAAVYQLEKPNETGAYLVDHSRTAVLFAPTGQPLMLVRQDGTPQEIADDYARWVR
jgi:protein SCO1